MIGTTIDRFRVISRIGQGGMGSVWKAEDTLLHRPVALKVLSEELAESPTARARFLREARAASSLSHPCVATVFGAGQAGPHVYIALALIDGETVAVFQGVPGDVAGIRFSRLVERSPVTRAQVPAGYAARLEDGVQADSLADARALALCAPLVFSPEGCTGATPTTATPTTAAQTTTSTRAAGG